MSAPNSTEWILEALAGGVLTTNKQGQVLYVNHSAQQMIGCQGQDVVGQPVNKVLDLEDSQGNALVPKVMELHKAHPQHLLQFGQVKLHPRQGDSSFVELHTSFLQDQDKTLVFLFRDVQTDRRVINRLYQQASHDALTGLMNRRSFEEYLEQAAHNERPGDLRAHVLVSIDLDKFKIVNDSCGHQAGDELLKQVAQIFQRAVRQTDKVARMGGDEFAIFLEGCSLEKARSIMDAVLIELKNYRFSWEGNVFNISASIGLVEFFPSSEVVVKNLFSDADKACYTAKALGRNQTFVHISSDETYHSQKNHTDWGKLLDLAMENDCFILFVQPIVPLQNQDDSCKHYEVLLRLPFRKHLLSPGSFLPAADRLDMMGRIDRWIIRRVLKDTTENNLNTQAARRTRLMINLSSQAVQDPGLFEYIEQQMKEFAADPSLFCFEISESVAIANFMQTRRLMQALRAMGCHLALDDFGSGFSSLNYVRELPLAYLKIDGNFVHNLVSNAVDAAMIKAVHEVGRVMELKTIAELVEDSETMSQLRTIGVDYAQGFHCGKPFPFMHLCESGTANTG
ncbi:MAG: EAL domain-containing protein [Thiolinea sp.]